LKESIARQYILLEQLNQDIEVRRCMMSWPAEGCFHVT
jgi:hypothetical protein